MLFNLFNKAKNSTIGTIVSAHVPQNLRQYYADKIMYLMVCEEYGIQAEV